MADHSDPFTGQLGFGQAPALLVVDMVRAYTQPDCALYAGPHMPRVVDAIAQLIDRAHQSSIPVFFTGVSVPGDGSQNGVFFRKAPVIATFDHDVFGALVPELVVGPDDVVLMKHYPSAFFGTPLLPMLTSRAVDTVVVCGVSTSGCIRATATDTMQHGFVPIVVADAVGDRDANVHEANLYDIQAKIGDVIDLESALAGLSSAAARTTG